MQDVRDQKLIYSGKLLDDSQKISEVIRSYKDVYQQHHIFHLVCASKNITNPPVQPTTPASKDDVPARPEVNSSNSTNELRQRHPSNQQQQQTVPPVAGATLGQGVAHPWIQYWQQTHAATAAAPSSAPLANPHALFQQQALMYNAWMQQVYVQYMQELALR